MPDPQESIPEILTVDDAFLEYTTDVVEEVSQFDLDPEQMAEVILGVRQDPGRAIEAFIVIKTKDKRLIRPTMNRAQRRFLAIIVRHFKAGKPVRVMILKARQMGFSTAIQCLFFLLTITTPNCETWTLAHDREASRNLLGMSKLMYDYLPELITPMVDSSDKIRMLFQNPNPKERKNPSLAGLRSRIYIDQAKNSNAGRSTTITFLHISEEAFWGATGPDTKLSLFQAVPEIGGTIIVRETTANGMGDPAEFQADWDENYGKPDAAWLCLFFGTHEHDEYRMPVPEKLKGPDGRLILKMDPDKEWREPDLRAGAVARSFEDGSPVALDDEQLYWRRRIMATKCKNDVGKFMQEYPYNPQEAFQTSGRPWFTRAGLEWLSKHVTPPMATGYFEHPRPEGWHDIPGKDFWRNDNFRPDWVTRGHYPRFTTDDTGHWWIWREPEPGREYIVAVDTAEGNEDGDPSAIQVLTRDTLEQVAEFQDFLDMDLLAHQAAMACVYYNDAWAIPEINNTGYAFMETFKKLWRRIYFRQDPDAPVGSEQRWKYGFRTDVATRPIITQRAQAFVRECPDNGWPLIHSSRLMSECRTFQKDKSGCPRAIGKKAHDDLVLAWCLAFEESARRPVRVTREKRELTLLDDRNFQEHQKRMRQRRGRTGRARYY